MVMEWQALITLIKVVNAVKVKEKGNRETK